MSHVLLQSFRCNLQSLSRSDVKKTVVIKESSGKRPRHLITKRIKIMPKQKENYFIIMNNLVRSGYYFQTVSCVTAFEICKIFDLKSYWKCLGIKTWKLASLNPVEFLYF